MDFGRMVTAMVTPFTQEQTIDWKATEKLIEHLIATGTESIVVSGTTGESPTLTTAEKLELFSFATKQANSRVKIIAGTGSNNTVQTIAFTKEVEQIGVDGVMLVAPYYNKPSQLGLVEHFSAIVKQTSLPVMLYNNPARTVINMSVETMVKIASSANNVVAIKESSGDLGQVSALISKLPKDVRVYSGDDNLTLPILAVGGVGIVSVASHLVGSEIQKMIRAFFDGQVEEAGKIHRQLLPLFNAIFITNVPAPVKFALSERGIIEETVRLPIGSLSIDEKNCMRAVLASF